MIEKIKHIAKKIAKENTNEKYGSAHLIKALLHRDFDLLRHLDGQGVDVYYVEEWAEVHIENYPKSSKSINDPTPDEDVYTIFEESESIQDKIASNDIAEVLAVFIATITPGVGFSYDKLKTLPISPNELLEQAGSPSIKSTAGESLQTIKKNKKSLSKYTIEKRIQVSEGLFSKLFSRDKELKMMAEILSRKSKPHVIIRGESGVGKTSLVNKLVDLTYGKKILTQLNDIAFYELDMSGLFVGASYKGEVEDRLQSVFLSLRTIEKPILIIDDIHILFDTNTASANTANLIKDELSKGIITFIGVTNNNEFRKKIASDDSVERRFQTLELPEPDVELCFRIIKSVINQYEDHHKLLVEDDVIKETILLSKRYLKEKSLPDSAIDLIDRTMAAVTITNQSLEEEVSEFRKKLTDIIKDTKNSNDAIKELDWLLVDVNATLSPIVLEEIDQGKVETKTDVKSKQKVLTSFFDKLHKKSKKPLKDLTQENVATMVSVITGIPAGKVKVDERERLLNIEETLKKRVIGQDYAVKTVSDAIVESRSGLSKEGQPIGSFFFSGPTGTGKTELAKALAEFLFGDESAIIRFDMSEFKEEHSAALLYGAPPGYVGYEEGGVLVNKIRQKPYAIVLFDEIEKAHQSVFDVFLQILDEGKLHDRLGKEGDFSNAVILFTSNIGSDYIISSFEKEELPSTNELMEIMSNYFRPEFLGRLTEIVPFAPISEKYVSKIFSLHLKKELLNLTDKLGFNIEMSQDVIEHLAKKGFSPKYGVRPLKSVIRTDLKKPLAKMVVSNKIPKSKKVKITLKDGELLFN